MKLKKCIFTVCITSVLSLFSFNSFASSPYIWSNSSTGLLETMADSETNLKLESGGAILIEQSSRYCII